MFCVIMQPTHKCHMTFPPIYIGREARLPLRRATTLLRASSGGIEFLAGGHLCGVHFEGCDCRLIMSLALCLKKPVIVECLVSLFLCEEGGDDLFSLDDRLACNRIAIFVLGDVLHGISDGKELLWQILGSLLSEERFRRLGRHDVEHSLGILAADSGILGV